MASASTSTSVNGNRSTVIMEMSISESCTLVNGGVGSNADSISIDSGNNVQDDNNATNHNRAHSLGAISMCSSSSENASNHDPISPPGDSSHLIEADDDSYQSLFPLSKKPWSEIPTTQSVSVELYFKRVIRNPILQSGVILPLTGLIAEANCLVEVVRAERDVRIAEQRLARCHVKESILRARLYKIQDAKARRLVQISSNQVGRAQAEAEASMHHIQPNIVAHFAGGALRV